MVDTVERFEDRRQIVATEASFRGGVNVAAGQLNTATAAEEIVAGAGYGGGPVVRVFNADGTAFSSFFAYESSFRNGVNVAVGDVLSTANGAITLGAAARLASSNSSTSGA